MRVLLFVAAFLVALILTMPLERLVLDALRGPLASAGATIDIEKVGLALPAGLRARSVRIDSAQAGLQLDSVYFGLTRSLDAEACGGRIEGGLYDDSVTLDLKGVDPSRCLRIGKLLLEGAFDGTLQADDVDPWNAGLGESAVARIDLACDGGTVGGSLVGARQDGGDLPLGEWEFRDFVLQATMAGGELVVEQGHASTSGVEWQLLGARLTAGRPQGLRVDFRARAIDDSPRARALIGLLPKGRVDPAGWHNFRVTGTLATPRVVALD